MTENDRNLSVGNLIRKLRQERNLSQQQLAKAISVDIRRISFYENGKMIPSTEVLIRLGKFFDVSLDYLLSGKWEGIRKFQFQDQELFSLFQQIDRFPIKDQNTIKEVLQAFIFKNKVKNLDIYK